MTDTPPPSNLGIRAGRAGKLADDGFRWVATIAGAAVLIILAWMIASTTLEALPIFQKEGLSFFTSDVWRPGPSRVDITGQYGAAAFIFGTVVTAIIGIIIALPLATGIALFLTEVASERLRRPMAYTIDLLAMIPSVIIGLWAVDFFVPVIVFPVMEWMASTIGQVIPLFAPPAIVRSIFAAGVVLSLMILPIITAIVREVFGTTPVDERYAAFGMGATRWEVMSKVVLPRGRPGMIGATMLGLGRALGETVAVLLVIGGSPNISVELFRPGQSIAGQIASGFGEASPEGISGLIALGVALFAITIVINILARTVIWRIGQISGDAAL
jgi:phosphate transport system permease protein